MNTFHTTFSRTLTSSDIKQNIPFPFTVPAGTTQINIRLSFSPWIVDNRYNMLTLSVFDPDGWRGAGHRHGATHEVFINAHSATPGYRAGEIQAGEWRVVVDTHMIMPGVSLPIQIDVTGTDDAIAAAPTVHTVGKTASRGRGWYRGDLHAHTIHSDAAWDIPALLEWARNNQLDFCTLSDHNSVAGLAIMDAASSDELLTIGGLELTTFWGHALALGLRQWIDWRVRPPEHPLGGRTMNEIASEVQAHGGLFIIAHPRSVGDPDCTGCRWVYETMMPGNARAVEVWNEPWLNESDHNEEALQLAFDWLNQGYRLALTSGTDNHGRAAHDEGEPYGFDVVYAEDLSEREILRAVQRGRLYLSSGPRLELTASANGAHAMMGDVLNVKQNAPIQINAQWDAAPDQSQFTLIVDGAPREIWNTGPSGAQTLQLIGGQDHWCLITLRASNGEMLALTNPIFLDGH
ncbi:MAG TPA: CehA/McbA family metallohydrolase [Anaerolineae bacterium]|nr:CehA/McbA family metallohydrolase [Anaerolineae bacterium]